MRITIRRALELAFWLLIAFIGGCVLGLAFAAENEWIVRQ